MRRRCYTRSMAKEKLWDPRNRGHKGGTARAKRLSPEERQQGARKAALARWRKTPKAERSEGARRAVLVRWQKYRAAKKKTTKP